MRLDEQGLRAFSHWSGYVGELSSADKQRALRLSDEPLTHLAKLLFNPPSSNWRGESKAYQRPVVDELYGEVASKLGLSPRPFWPEGQPYALCVTHDIDRVFATVHRLKERQHPLTVRLKNALRDTLTTAIPWWHEENPFFNFKRIEHLERQWGIKSACYVLFEKRRPLMALRRREIQHFIGVYAPETIFEPLRRFEAAGNEVGLHSSFDSWHDGEALSRELTRLRAGGITDIKGGRTHYLNFDATLTPTLQAQAGLEYDSTLGFNFHCGFRSGTSFPYSLGPIWELPFQLMDSALRWRWRDLNERLAVATHLLDETRKRRGALVLNWHSHTLHPELHPEETDLLFRILQIAQADGAWIARPCDIINWWERRSYGAKRQPLSA